MIGRASVSAAFTVVVALALPSAAAAGEGHWDIVGKQYHPGTSKMTGALDGTTSSSQASFSSVTVNVQAPRGQKVCFGQLWRCSYPPTTPATPSA